MVGNILVKNYTRQMGKEKKKKLNEELIVSLVPTVKRMCIRVKNRIYSDLSVDDLFGISIVALMEAAGKIDDSDQEKYKHYLLKRAKGAIYDELRKEDVLSRSSREFLENYKRATDLLREHLDREPSYGEIAQVLKMDEDTLLEELRKTEKTGFYSLESWYQREDGSSSFDDVVAGDSEIGEEKVGELDLQNEILGALDKLGFQERLVMSFYYYDELNFKEIALILGLSVGRISQLHTKAIHKLKELVKTPGTPGTETPANI